jgi:Mn2+/Fe2+ NRAMP family transporter
MEYLGYASLGGFIGFLMALGLQFVTDMPAHKKALSYILAGAFGSVVFGFIQFLSSSSVRGIFCYPIGLLLSLLWYYVRESTDNIKSDKKAMRYIGWAHLIGVILATTLALVLVLPPAFREIFTK